MSDIFDPSDLNAVSASGAQAPKAGLFDDDVIGSIGAKGSLVSQIPGQDPRFANAEPEKPVSTLDRLVKGPLEAAGAIATGAVSGVVGNLSGIWKGLTGGKYGTPQGAQEAAQHAQDVTQALTYQPRSEAGKQALGTLANVMDASKLAGMGPTESITLGGMAAMPMGARWIGKDVTPTGQMASVGAAGAKPADIAVASVFNSSPELQQMVRSAVKNLKPGQALNQEVLDRLIAADSVGVKMTKGQMTQNVVDLSNEVNNRLARPAIAKRLSEQNAQLIQKTSDLREAVAPDVFETSKPAVGQIPIQAYLDKDVALNKVISANYQALKDANGGQFPLDVKAFVQSATDELHKNLLFDHVPSAIKSTIARLLENNSMTFENFESMRTNLARIMRSATADGNEKAAAGVIRGALENMPMTPEAEAAGLKPLADAARASAKQRFDLIASDPAYKAVVTGKAVPDTFINKYVVKAPLQQVQTMKANLAHDPVAQQAVASGVIDHLREAARIGADNTGNFAQASFNKELGSLRPKLGAIFDPKTQRELDNLGTVSRLVKGAPAGSAINTSNTATALIGEAAKSSLEGAANVAAGGVPIGTWGRKIGATIREARAVKGTLNPGSKVLLKDIMK